MVALGAPISAVCIWNRWTSQRQAWEYAVPGPDWEFELLDQVPWPHPVAGVTTLPLSSVPLWPAGALGRCTAPDASSSPIIIMVGSDDEGDDTDDGVLGAPGTHHAVALRGWERRARHPSGEQHATPAPRARTTPPTQAQGPPVEQRCFVRRSLSARDGTSRKRKPLADAAAITAPGAGQGQLVPAPERLCGNPISEHILDAAVLTAIKGSVDHRRADSLLRMWWAESHRWALDRPTVSPDDETLLHDTLHHLATHGPPDEASSPQPGDGHAVTIELAGRGLGPAG